MCECVLTHSKQTRGPFCAGISPMKMLFCFCYFFHPTSRVSLDMPGFLRLIEILWPHPSAHADCKHGLLCPAM